jgi:hypothetical protein
MATIFLDFDERGNCLWNGMLFSSKKALLLIIPMKRLNREKKAKILTHSVKVIVRKIVLSK